MDAADDEDADDDEEDEDVRNRNVVPSPTDKLLSNKDSCDASHCSAASISATVVRAAF